MDSCGAQCVRTNISNVIHSVGNRDFILRVGREFGCDFRTSAQLAVAKLISLDGFSCESVELFPELNNKH